jgi:N-methylhydantoinase B
MKIDAIQLEIFKHLFAAIAEEMGAALQRASFSPNIKERKDFSCAVFNATGALIAQAAHIPVHLGSMPLSVQAAIRAMPLADGDVVILNDPYQGGTHLPDITLVSPVFEGGALVGYVANRAHHADVGGMAPGSMPVARELVQEGLIIPPIKLVAGGELQQGVWDLILRNTRTPVERAGDLRAQLAANRLGASRLAALVAKYGAAEVAAYGQELLAYTERMMRALIAQIPDGSYSFADQLDDDGISDQPIAIKVRIDINGDTARVDFTGSDPQAKGSVNAVYAITLSAVYYVFRCLLAAEVPSNAGALAAIEVIAPEGSIVNARPPAPVVGGNVETSQRIVDVLFGALAQALPDRVPAASQGSMNNTLIGGWDAARNRPFTYYETIGGGMGGRPSSAGPSGIHSHMTNTLNTPAEAMEYAYPVQVVRYELREDSGGAGQHRGGEGLRRDLLVLAEATASLLSERRRFAPYGLRGGAPGALGANVLIRDGIETNLAGKGPVALQPGDVLSIRTPGGGGWGLPLLY